MNNHVRILYFGKPRNCAQQQQHIVPLFKKRLIRPIQRQLNNSYQNKTMKQLVMVIATILAAMPIERA